MTWIGLAVGLLGIAAVAAGVFRAFWPVAPGPDYRSLSPVARGALEQRIRRDPNEPDRTDPPTDLPLLRTAAGIMLAQRNLLTVLLGCFLIQLGTTLSSWDRVHLIVTVVFAVPVGWLALYVGARSWAGVAFLERYPAPDDASAEPAPDATPAHPVSGRPVSAGVASAETAEADPRETGD